MSSAPTTPARAGPRASPAGRASQTSAQALLPIFARASTPRPSRSRHAAFREREAATMGTAAAPGVTGRESGCRHPRAREERTSRAVSAPTSCDLRRGESPHRTTRRSGRRPADPRPRCVYPFWGTTAARGERHGDGRPVPVGRPANAPREDGQGAPTDDHAGGGRSDAGSGTPAGVLQAWAERPSTALADGSTRGTSGLSGRRRLFVAVTAG